MELPFVVLALVACFILYESLAFFLILVLFVFFAVKRLLDDTLERATCDTSTVTATAAGLSLEWFSKPFEYISRIRATYDRLLQRPSERKKIATPVIKLPLQCGPSPVIDEELQVIVDHIIEDYIMLWYKDISPDNDDFVEDCRVIFKHIFNELITRCLTRVDRVKFTQEVLDLLVEHLRDPTVSQTPFYESQETFIGGLIEEMLTLVGPLELEYLKHTKCSDKQTRDSLFRIIRELLTHAVVIPIVSYVSDPLWLNKMIIILFALPSEDQEEEEAEDQYHKRKAASCDKDDGSLKMYKHDSESKDLLLDSPERRASSASLEKNKLYEVGGVTPRINHLANNFDMKRSISADVYSLAQSDRGNIL